MSPVAEATDITRRLCDAVVQAGLISAGRLAEAQVAASAAGRDLGAVLAESGAISAGQAGMVLERELGIPRVDLTSYAPEPQALALVPADMAAGRGILPLFEIDGMLTVAVGNPLDVFTLGALAGEVGADLEPVLASPSAVTAAIRQYYGSGTARTADDVSWAATASEGAGALTDEPADATREKSEVVDGGPRGIDLDVLAVADARRAAQLATDILEHALSAGADAVHLVPYKDDFFLAYRVAGALERIASAPLALEGALVEAFRSVTRVPATLPGAPARGRARLHFAEREVAVISSVLPTLAGTRLVVSLVGEGADAPTLDDLGLSRAEARAVKALVERGRGLLVLFAPAGQGTDDTYRAAIGYAAEFGRTVVSVERAIRREFPAVAQTLIDPGSATGGAPLLAAALGQDVEVIGLDGLATPEELRLAVEAAISGKLAVVALEAADVAHGVRRLFELGAEPHGLAAALALLIAQRRVRRNCPQCTTESPSALLAQVPGVPEGTKNRKGVGCPACDGSGLNGTVTLFEALPMTRSLRALIALRPNAQALAAAAAASGMRTLAEAGARALVAGTVNADELATALLLAPAADRA